MGNQMSLTPEQIDEIKTATEFSESELKRLFRKFKKLDTDKSGSLSINEFLALPELEHNPLVHRVVHTFDIDKNGEVSFNEFIQSITMFIDSTKNNNRNVINEKLNFTFRLYDVDNDGYISNADLFYVLKSMVGNNLNDTQLQQLVDRTIIKGDIDKDGKLSYNEYIAMVENTDIGEKLRIDKV